MSRRFARSTLVFAVVGLSFAACTAAQNIINEAKSNTLMVSQLVTTPPEAVAGQTVPAKVAATVYLVTVDPTNPSNATPTPITGAVVSVQFNGTSISLTSSDGGAYYADSFGNPTLTYVSGSTYRFEADVNGQTYAQDVQAPQPEVITEFHTGLTAYTFDAGSFLLADGGYPPLPDGGEFQVPSLTLPDGGIPGFVAISAGQNLTLTRADAVNGTPTTAVTVVVPLDTNYQPESPSYTSPDTSISGVLSLIFSPSTYRTPTITIPGASAWPSCTSSDYVLTVTGLATGSNEGSNLFTASASFAGSADAAPAHCSP